VIIFGSVRFLPTKVTKLKLFFLKKTETGFGSVRFGYFAKKFGKTCCFLGCF